MINKAELRIGNIVSSVVNLRKQVTVLQLFSDSYQGDFGNSERGALTYEYSEGIHITEEWLKRAGFETEYTNGGFLRWQKGEFKLLDRRLPYPQWHSSKSMILQVHQLQNLYWCLCGKELDIKVQ